METETTTTEGQSGQQQQTQQSNNQPFAIFPDSASLNDRLERASKKGQEVLAKELGFDSVDAMKAKLKPEQQPASQQQTQQPSEADRLKLALNVAAEVGLPATLIGRLQGNTAEELKVDAERLQALFQSGQSQTQKNGIPNAPNGNKPVVFTRQQLQDPKFVRENKDAILAASREGRIK